MSNTQIFGYINARTGVVLRGEHRFFTEIANPRHPDNQGRLSTFTDPQDEEYGLEWRMVTDADEWQGILDEEARLEQVRTKALVPPAAPAKAVAKKPAGDR